MSGYDPKLAIDKEEHGDPFDELQAGIDSMLQKAKAKGYQAQVNAMTNISGISRFAVNQMTQHTDINNLSFSLKLLKGKQQASATTTKLGEDGYSALFEQVESNLLKSPEIPFLQGLPSPKGSSNADLTGVEWQMEERAEAVIEAVNAASELTDDYRLAGTVSTNLLYYRIVSTEGMDAETSTSYNYFKVNAITGPADGRGYGQEEGYWRYDRPDVSGWAREAMQTAIDTTEQKLITKDSGDYEVLLGPQAVNDLMVYVMFGADAVSFHESNSYASDRLGDQIFDENLTILDSPRDPKEAIGCRVYDSEGVPTEDQKFYDEGVLKFIPYSSFLASKYLDDKDLASGHLTGPEFGWMGGAAIPVSTSIVPGDKTLEQQISEIEDGLYVKNFWYNRFTKRREGGLTGLTRNGLYHVKDGEVQGAVRNLRYTESFVNAFGQGNIASVSSERRKYFLSNVPSLHLNKYHFSSVAHTSQQLE